MTAKELADMWRENQTDASKKALGVVFVWGNAVRGCHVSGLGMCTAWPVGTIAVAPNGAVYRASETEWEDIEPADPSLEFVDFGDSSLDYLLDPSLEFVDPLLDFGDSSLDYLVDFGDSSLDDLD